MGYPLEQFRTDARAALARDQGPAGREAHVYNEGAIHSLGRPLETRLVRVSGCDLDKTLRYRYAPDESRVKVLEPQAG